MNLSTPLYKQTVLLQIFKLLKFYKESWYSLNIKDKKRDLLQSRKGYFYRNETLLNIE